MMPLPPVPVEKSGELTENEYEFILSSCLKPVHRQNSKVVEFIEAFVRCKSIPQASAECGIHSSLGYKYRHRADIAQAIEKITARSTIKYGFDASEVMERAKEMVDFDPIALQNPDGSFKSNLHDIAPEARRSIKKMKVKNIYQKTKDMNGMDVQIIVGEVIDYEFYSKEKMIDLVGKEKEMFKTTTKVEHTVTKDMAAVLLASKQRAEEFNKQLKEPEAIEVTDYKES